jgi:serine/threonine-protein kinase
MKGKLYTLGFGLVLVALLAGCTLAEKVTSITGSGNVVAQEKDITGFDKVDVSQAFKVEIRQGDTFKVVIRIDDNLVEHLEVVKEGKTLKIGLKPVRIYNIRQATMEAQVTMPELTGLELSGASHGTITGFKSTKALDVDVSGASQLRGDVVAGDARFEVSGASQMILSGSAGDVTIDASGASKVDLSAFTVADASVGASGASSVTLNLSGRLDAEASGASHVYYLGNPTLGSIDTSGASSVKHK